MRERILTHGAESLADYELLEVLLFHAVPRRDTKPQAKALLAAFGSLGRLLQAPAGILKEKGVSERVVSLLALPVMASRVLMSSDEDAPLKLGDSKALMRYLAGALQRVTDPAVGLLCLDSSNSLIKEDIIPEKGGLHAAHGKVARLLLACHATAVIIIYYHPQAPATALAPEVRGLKQALQALAITVHEAVLVSEGWRVSMSETGLL